MKARITLAIHPSLPVGLRPESVFDDLVDLGLTGIYQSGADLIEASDLSSAAGTRDNVVILGRVVWKDEQTTAALSAAE